MTPISTDMFEFLRVAGEDGMVYIFSADVPSPGSGQNFESAWPFGRRVAIYSSPILENYYLNQSAPIFRFRDTIVWTSEIGNRGHTGHVKTTWHIPVLSGDIRRNLRVPFDSAWAVAKKYRMEMMDFCLATEVDAIRHGGRRYRLRRKRLEVCP